MLPACLYTVLVSSLISNGPGWFTRAPAAASAARSQKCIGENELSNYTNSFLKKFWNEQSRGHSQHSQDMRTCAQAAKDMRGELSNRSLAPWTYSMDTDNNRIPETIAMAKCLCIGCVINQKEDSSYNSVTVTAVVMVLNKTECQGDPKKYVLKKAIIRIPVACVCAVPKVRNV